MRRCPRRTPPWPRRPSSSRTSLARPGLTAGPRGRGPSPTVDWRLPKRGYEKGAAMDKQEVIERCRRDNVAFVRLQFTEPYGPVKNVSIPVDELEKALDNELMFDGSSIRGFKRIEQSDMYFLPDPDTYTVLPWRGTDSARTARLICDVADPGGTPFAGDPRTHLRRALKSAP